MPDLFDLDDKTALVTGGAGLIGREATAALAEHGADVVIGDLDTERGERVAEDLGEGVRFVRTDVTAEGSVRETIDLTVREFGGIDVLVNCAYPGKGDPESDFEDLAIDGWRERVDRHLIGHVLAIMYATDVMLDQEGGSIVNFGSIYGVQAPDFTVYEGTDLGSTIEYATAKGGILNLTRYLASHLGPHGIRVNAISPGGVFDDQDPTFVEQYERRTPLGRMAEPEDLKGAVVFLASDASAYVTGHNLVVDGGWTIR